MNQDANCGDSEFDRIRASRTVSHVTKQRTEKTMNYEDYSEAKRIAAFLSQQNSGVKFYVWQHGPECFCVSRGGSGVLCGVWLNGFPVSN